ncbi:hypothetical protein SUNI508_06680 [Seiridium unicorne]|uniref:Luciferase domain-containing protein n=1 Tax=Seiridium unicorne TaxID=138068 RepID=A0ABR2UZW5_9PEZI
MYQTLQEFLGRLPHFPSPETINQPQQTPLEFVPLDTNVPIEMPLPTLQQKVYSSAADGLRATVTFAMGIWHILSPLLHDLWFTGPWEYMAPIFPALWSAWKTYLWSSSTFCWLVIPYLLYAFFFWIQGKYYAYLDLGRGDTPSTFRGWWRVTFLRWLAGIDVLSYPRVSPHTDPYRGRLWDLPRRHGRRPTVKGVAPQRQVDAKANPSTFFVLAEILQRYAADHPKELRFAPSFLEGHLGSLQLNLPAGTATGLAARGTPLEFGGEICHAHRNDGSIHIVLHPEDVRTVVEAGWGERHPLSSSTWYWRFYNDWWAGERLPVPETLVLMYAPLHQGHLDVFEQILQAAIWWNTREIDGGRGMLYPVTSKTYAVDKAPFMWQNPLIPALFDPPSVGSWIDDLRSDDSWSDDSISVTH